MIQLTDAHAHIKNEKQAMERITLGIPTMACAGIPGEMQELEKFGRLQGAEKILIPACGLHPWYSDKWEPEEMFSLMEKVPVIGEIGMDSVWCDVPLDRQRKALSFTPKARKRRSPVSYPIIQTPIWSTGFPGIQVLKII